MRFFSTSIALINSIIILLAISLTFTFDSANKNMLLIGAMSLSPLVLLSMPYPKFRVDLPLTLIFTMMIGFAYILHPDSLRWPTIIYSSLFFLFFIALTRVLGQKQYTYHQLASLIKWLIYAYCIVLLIQQLCVLMGWPIVNVSVYNPREPWKLNILMAEPSFSARTVPILMFFYILTKEQILNTRYILKEQYKYDKVLWWAFSWIILTMGSATAYLFLSIILLKIIPTFKKAANLTILLIGIGTALTLGHNNPNLQRVYKVVSAVITLNERQIILADNSGAHRIVSSIRGAKFVGLNDTNDWFGHGVDADQKLVPSFSKALPGSAGAFMLWVNYGFLVALLWWCFSFNIVYLKEAPFISTLVWFLTVFIMAGLNNQILWLVLALSYTYKQLRNVPRPINQYTHESHSHRSWQGKSCQCQWH